MTTRRSRVSDDATMLLFADLHNHTLLSDGAGDPETAFARLRAAGLEVAALTDHASIPHHQKAGIDPADYPDEAALRLAMGAPHSFDAEGWTLTGKLADAADVPGEFTAVRGFEWTEPWVGHANVWYSADYLDVQVRGRVDGLHAWLSEEQPDALFGYNHPGREPGRFGEFHHDAALAERMVTLEVFNRYDDYLFAGSEDGQPAALQACLAQGWRPGLVGVSDEHGGEYGVVGKGRTGIWAHEHSRGGVREALLARRVYATREVGLHLDATLDGARMGSGTALGGAAELAVDLAADDGAAARSAYAGAAVVLQLLGPGPDGVPAVTAEHDATVGEVTRVTVDVAAGAPWLVLRVADAQRRNAWPGPAGHPGNAYALAYASPWYAA